MSSTFPRPPLDPELAPVLAAFPEISTLEESQVEILRKSFNFTADQALSGKAVFHEERQISGPDGSSIMLSIIRPITLVNASSPSLSPGIYWIHGGGLILGTRFAGLTRTADWAIQNNAIVISVEYRLAPENPYPAGLEDCYAGLLWASNNLDELGIEKTKLMVGGDSAGGGLAASLALLCRDRKGPALCGQMLLCPMLDDRNETCSAQQYLDSGLWNGQVNRVAWSWYLADEKAKCAGKDISIYAIPGRATDLSNLPPTFIDCGSAEVFRDEAVAYASRLWACGVSAELHVWSGGFHGFIGLAPNTTLAKAGSQAQTSWVARIFSR